QRWAGRIGLAPQAHETPWEQAQAWSRALPEGESSIRQITGSYVHLRFSRPQVAAAAPEPMGAGVPGAPGNPELAADAAAWQELQPLFTKAWLRRFLPKRRPASNSQYTLTPSDS
ncbi:MAG: DUF4129 domain-containing protein, partial [Caldilineaceae bacterium]